MHGLRAHCFKKFLYTMMHECMLAVMFRFKHYRFKRLIHLKEIHFTVINAVLEM